MNQQTVFARRWAFKWPLVAGLGLVIAAPALTRGHDNDDDDDDASTVLYRSNFEHSVVYTSLEEAGDEPSFSVSPSTRIRVGYDSDGDGSIDSYGCVFASDLQQALAGGWDREQGGRALGRLTQRIEGTIDRIRTETPAGFTEQHLIAFIESRDGRIEKVDLGSRDQLSHLNLSEGDRISVRAFKDQVAGRPMLMALEIQKGDRAFAVGWPQRELREYSGRILSTRIEQVRGENHVLADVRLQDGQKVTVDLGSRNKLQDVRLFSGKEVTFTASRWLGGRADFVAQQLTLDGRTYDVGEGRFPLRGEPVSPDSSDFDKD